MERSWTNTIHAFSTSTLFIIFCAVEALVWGCIQVINAKRKGTPMKKAFKEIIAPHLYVPLILWTTFFGFIVIKTIYDDHQSLVIRIAALKQSQHAAHLSTKKELGIEKRNGQRPWVFQDDHQFIPRDIAAQDVNDKTLIFAVIVVKNTGNSPALRTRVLVDWFADTIDSDDRKVHVPKPCITANDPPRKYKGTATSEQQVRDLPLPPNSHSDNVEYHNVFQLTDDHLNAIRSNEETLYMTGCVFYRDDAGEKFRTQICMKYRDKDTMKYCSTGNYTEHFDKEKHAYLRD